MSERKIFAGGRLRRARLRLGMNQTQMAERLGLSPSYLNLMERNQRPLTVQVLLKLSSAFNLDVGEFSSEEDAGIAEGLKEVFADPLLQDELPSKSEINDLVEAAPNAAAAIAKLHQAYREALARLSDLSGALSGGEHAGLSLPPEKVAERLEAEGGFVAELEELGEEIAAGLSPRDDPQAALRTFLKERFGIDLRILPIHVMPDEQARFDRHSSRLFVSECVPATDRTQVLARQAALLAGGGLLDRLSREREPASAEARRLLRAALALRLADAVLMPKTRFSEAAVGLQFDIARLANRFAVGRDRVMARLAILGASGGSRLPAASYIAVDPAGSLLSRLNGAGLPLARFGPLCGRLPIFDELSGSRVITETIAYPDGAEFQVIACAEEGQPEDQPTGPRRLVMVAWRREAIGRPPAGAEPTKPRPVGVTCRLCERLDCRYRAALPATRPAAFDDHIVGPSHHAAAPLGTPC